MYRRNVILTLSVLGLMGAMILGPATPATAQEHEHDHAQESESTHQNDNSEKPYTIHFNTHPDPDGIVPDSGLVELIFRIKDDGEPAGGTELSYRVYAPPKSFWFSTDFPIVEGSKLLSGTVDVPNGQQTITMMLPIRGEYRVKTSARGPEGLARKTFHFNVSENPREVINLSIFLVFLFVIGGIGGYIFSRTKPDNIPSSWLIGALLAGGLFYLASPSTVQAHGQGSWDPHTLEEQRGSTTLDEQTALRSELFPQPVHVGEMLKVNYRVTVSDVDRHARGHEGDNHTEHSPAEIMAEAHFVHSEGGLEMANQNVWLDNGQGAINIQLFDGAPHYLVTRFYRRTEAYAPAGHTHGESRSGDKSAHESVKTNGDGHGHDSSFPWEAELEYELDAGEYTVRFQESADPAMKWLLFPTAGEQRRETARHRMEGCETVESGGAIPANTDCYNLTLNPDGTSFTLNINDGGRYSLFTQHLPREFDMTIEDADGTVLEPNRHFVTGKGEYLGRSVKWVDVSPVSPPFDDIMKAMITLLAVTGLGVFAGFKGPEWIG